jgi:ankyrin repeat protein
VFKRRRDADTAVYVHLALDGGIFHVDGATGLSGWLTERQLIEKLDAVSRTGGTLLYSREAPEADPPDIVMRTFERITDAGLPIRLVTEAHPQATIPGRATTLMMAAHAGDLELARDLLDRGSPLEARDEDGYTALMYAANAGREDAAGLLVDAGSDPNARDNDDSTPLMFASQHGRTELVRALLEHGADASIRGSHGLTALGFARQNGHEETAAVLEAAGSPA